METLLFCEFDDPQFESISNFLCSAFNTTRSELLGFYQSLKADFDLADFPKPIFADRSFFKPRDDRFRADYDSARAISCDLPSLLSKGGKDVVMLIAQDPYNDQAADGIWIGTPYALHIKKCRENRHTRQYLRLIDVLLEAGYQVYLTDIYKIDVHGKQLSRKDKKWFRSILEEEVELVKPAAVITWGRKAEYAVRKLTLQPPHYAYPHPSGNARSSWAKLIGASATDQRILDYWRTSILERLS
jgi:hypothetical protein